MCLKASPVFSTYLQPITKTQREKQSSFSSFIEVEMEVFHFFNCFSLYVPLYSLVLPKSLHQDTRTPPDCHASSIRSCISRLQTLRHTSCWLSVEGKCPAEKNLPTVTQSKRHLSNRKWSQSAKIKDTWKMRKNKDSGEKSFRKFSSFSEKITESTNP